MWFAIASLLLGVIGWFATSFFAKPLLDFLNLRSQVHEELIFTANINDVDMLLYKRAVESLRRLGAKVFATNITASRLLRLYLSRAGYDLTKAGSNLIGLSNSLNLPGRALHINSIEKGLQLPLSSTPEHLQMVLEEIRHPRS